MDNNNFDATKPSITLALSGGGSRGIFHLGFIDALQENGVKIKAISGASAGSIAGAIVSCGIKPRDALEVFSSREFKEIFKFNWFLKSIFTIDLNAKLLDKLFICKDLSDAKIPFFSCIMDLSAKKVIYFAKGDARKLIYGSCALIPVFQPVKYKNHFLVDGGILDLMPTEPLKKFDYPILGINIMSVEAEIKYSLKGLMFKIFKLFISKKLTKNKRNCAWYIAPKEITKFKIFSFENLQEKFDLGYKYGQKWCKENIKVKTTGNYQKPTLSFKSFSL